MEQEREKKEQKRLDLQKYEPINSIEIVDLIMEEMKTNKIFPSDALKGVVLQRIRKIKVQNYLVEKIPRN
jgi:hypothetical protein